MKVQIVFSAALALGLTACMTAPERSTLSDGLVAHYSFSGNAKDSSVNKNDGVVHGAKLTTDRFGKPNGAYSFNGRSWIEVANSQSLQGVTNAMSYSAWVQVAKADGGWMPLLCKGRRRRQFSFELTEGDQIFINDHNGTGCGKTIAVSLPAGTFRRNSWCHVAATYDGKEMVAYIDGDCVGRTAVEDRFAADRSPLYIGMDPPEVRDHYFGVLDDIRIYNRALTEQEISALYERERCDGE